MLTDAAQRLLAVAGLASIALAFGAGSGWVARGVYDERALVKDELAQERATNVLAASDRRAARDASAGYQADAAHIRATLAQLRQEANDALRTPIPCAPGASAIALGDVPIPAASLDRLRRAGADVAPADRAASR